MALILMQFHIHNLESLAWPLMNFDSCVAVQCAKDGKTELSVLVENQKNVPKCFTMNGVWCPKANNLNPKPCKMFTIPATPAYLPNATCL